MLYGNWQLIFSTLITTITYLEKESDCLTCYYTDNQVLTKNYLEAIHGILNQGRPMGTYTFKRSLNVVENKRLKRKTSREKTLFLTTKETFVKLRLNVISFINVYKFFYVTF